MNIKLPGFVIAELYKDNLVIDEVQTIEQKVSAKKEEAKIFIEHFFLGENKKHILFLVNDANAKFINDEALATLTKILEALKMNLTDVAVINFYQTKKTFEELKLLLQPKFIFLFDISLHELKLPFIIPAYQIQQYDNCSFMIAPAITLSSSNDDLVKKEKKKLWENLKKIFMK